MDAELRDIFGRFERYFELIYGEIVNIKNDIVNIKSDIASMKSDIAGLKSYFAGLKSDFAGMAVRIGSVESGIIELRNDNRSIRADLRRLEMTDR